MTSTHASLILALSQRLPAAERKEPGGSRHPARFGGPAGRAMSILLSYATPARPSLWHPCRLPLSPPGIRRPKSATRTDQDRLYPGPRDRSQAPPIRGAFHRQVPSSGQARRRSFAAATRAPLPLHPGRLLSAQARPPFTPPDLWFGERFSGPDNAYPCLQHNTTHEHHHECRVLTG